MKLLTKEIVNRFKKYPPYSQSSKRSEAIAIAKFFLPLGAWTWYVLEYDMEENIAFGVIVDGQGECEFGYFSMDELQQLKATRYRLTVERDIYFKPTKLSDIDNEYVKKFINRMYKED